LRKDHRPYFIKKAYLNFQKLYVRQFLRPQFKELGKGFVFMKPWNVEVFGSTVELGDYATVIASPDNKVRFSVWPDKKDKGRIKIGDYCLICPGVRISSAAEIIIGDSCMIASKVYITDSDWHDIYNRISAGKAAPVRIAENVWIGDSAIICKGVSIGENSIVGAGAVVVNHVPANSIAAGNPARLVKTLDPKEKITKRAHWYADPAMLFEQIDQWDKEILRKNTMLGWLRSILFPVQGD
jgi:acetyltransferase-like isoleucine patch superfamily enzyme